MRLAGSRHNLVPCFFLHARVLGENLQLHAVAELANHRRVGQRLFANVRGAVRRRLADDLAILQILRCGGRRSA